MRGDMKQFSVFPREILCVLCGKESESETEP